MRKEPIVAFLIALSVVASGCLNGDDGSEQDTNKAPTAQIESVTPSPAYAGQTVTFAGSGSDEDGFVVGYQWGSSLDGEISTDKEFSTNTLSVGEHTVYLKVVDDEGKWSSKDDLVLTILPENHAPVGNISVFEESVYVGEQVNFSAENISDPDGDELSYEWDFGDGNTSSDMETRHNYSQPGVYDVILAVSDGKIFNGVSTFVLVISVEKPSLPVGTFITGPDGLEIEGEPLTMDFVFSDVGENGAEPSIGVTSSGCIFFIAFEKPMRSCDHGETWVDTSDITHAFTNNPYGWVDPVTDRVFNMHMMGLESTWIGWSDDDGETWTGNFHDSGAAPKLGSGPWTDEGYGLSPSSYERAVYFCYNKSLYIACYTSYDGGATFEAGGAIIGLATTNNALHGAITTAPDGTVYLPPRIATPAIIFSKDNGLTWEERTMGEDVGTPNPRKNGEVATDTESNAYNIWVGGDQGVYMSRSTDSGDTWEQTSIRISPIEVISATFPHTSAGDPGRIAITYLGSENASALGQPNIDGEPWDGNAHYAPSDVSHYLYVTYSLNALDPEPVFHTQRVSKDPVQVGSICLNSGDCRDGNRNLLDFNDLHIDLEGRVYIGFADGCTGTCATGNATPENSRSRVGSVYYLGNGPSLYESIGNLTEFDAARATVVPVRISVERQILAAYSIDEDGIRTFSVIATMAAVAVIALRRPRKP